MTKEEYKQLIDLLRKLQRELGHRYAIIPEGWADGVTMAIYNDEGHAFKDTTSWNIESCVEKLKKE